MIVSIFSFVPVAKAFKWLACQPSWLAGQEHSDTSSLSSPGKNWCLWLQLSLIHFSFLFFLNIEVYNPQCCVAQHCSHLNCSLRKNALSFPLQPLAFCIRSDSSCVTHLLSPHQSRDQGQLLYSCGTVFHFSVLNFICHFTDKLLPYCC